MESENKITKVMRFCYFYLKSARLYYAFVTGFAGWAGIAAASTPFSSKMLIALAILFCGWGINQIINDWLGLPEDRINAPHRPMVTGELNVKWALTLSAALILMSCIISFIISPYSALILITSILLNVIYEYSKAIPVLANIVFGIMIALCYYLGLVFMRPELTSSELLTSHYVAPFLAIAVSNSTMTFFTYFKDYLGDKSVGKRTLVVVLGLKRSAELGWLLALLPFCIFATSYAKFNSLAQLAFFFSFLIALYTAWLYWKNHKDDATYFNLKWNFRACSLFSASVIAIYQPLLGVILWVIGFFFIGYLFSLYSDAKS